jgi:hypothetical protein
MIRINEYDGIKAVIGPRVNKGKIVSHWWRGWYQEEKLGMGRDAV